jgi:hypothetical protein
MPGFADLKARSRRKLHDALSYPAVFYATADADPKLIRVRKHITNPAMQGDMKGTNLSYAEIAESVAKLLFLTEDVPDLARGSIVVFDDETFLVDNALPPYNSTTAAEVKPAPAGAYDALTKPGDF